LLSQVQREERLQIAKVCGNCVHGESFHKLRGRLPQLLEASARAFQPGSPFLSSELVAALECLFRVQDWKSYCQVERTQVRMFERGCGNWEASIEGQLEP
jgi:hypothetical protein